MRELVRTNNAVLVSAIGALLDGAGIPHMVLDQHMSVLEGSLGILPRRILVEDERHDEASRLLQQAGLAHELRSPGSVSTLSAKATGVTDDAVLGGRLRLLQPTRGHRVGHDAILLAAATPAHPGDHVVDLGAGIGAAGLALAVRVPDTTIALIERDPELVALAAENIARNGMADRARALELDVGASEAEFAAVDLPPGSFDCVMMNPPFNDPSRSNVSPDEARRAAHVAPASLLAVWIDSASRLLHSAGVLTLIWRADGLADVLAALAPQFGVTAVLPVHGRDGVPAIRVLVSAAKASGASLVLLPPLVLNDAEGRPTNAAERVLRHSDALDLSGQYSAN